MSKLALIPIREIYDLQPAALHERSASRYLGMNRTYFRKIVISGLIPYTSHVNGRTRIYLKSDLDAYLQSLPRHTMAARASSPEPAPKGVAK